MLNRAFIALLLVFVCQMDGVRCGIGRMDSSLLFNANPASYGTTFGPHVRVATSVSDSRLLPTSVTVQAWVMPLLRDNGQVYMGTNDLGQVLGNMARTFSPSRLFAGYSIYCRDSSADQRACSFFVATSTSSFLEPTCSVPVQKWSHLCGVYDETTGVADMYLDGFVCASAANSGGAAAISYFLRSSFLVGAWMEDAPGTARSVFYFTGRVDEARVWSGARTRSQILADMFDTIAPATAATTPSLRLYLPCNDPTDSATVTDATGSFIPTLQPAGLAGGVPTFVAVDVDTTNSAASNFFRSAMDRPTNARLLFGQQQIELPPSANSSNINTFVLEMQKANFLVVSVIDPNPSDTAIIGTPSFYPSAGGLPNGAIMQPQVTAAAAYATPSLQGVVFSRTLLWLPSFDTEWLIPPGGLPVSVPLTEIAANPSAPSNALPFRTRNDLIAFKLYVAAPPEFLSAPPLYSLVEVEITSFIGLLVSFDVRARDRNSDETLLLQVAYDPGLPNFAAMSPASSNGLGSVIVSRAFTWAPTCKQARRHSVVFEAIAGGVKSQQRVVINVVSPAPTLVAFDPSLLISAPGCAIELELNAADASAEVRGLGLPSYGHVISYNLSDVTVGQPPLTVPKSSLTAASAVNAFGGSSAYLRVYPEFVHGGRTYLVCVTVNDACDIATHTRCRRIFVESCKTCAGPGATLSSLAQQFGTDFGSLYAVNTMLPDPDLILVNTVIAIGGTHLSTDGDTLASVADTFQTSVDQLRFANPSFATFGANASLTVGTSICVISRICELEQQCGANQEGGGCQK